MLSPSSNYIDNFIIRKLWNLTVHPLFQVIWALLKHVSPSTNTLLLLRILTISSYCILLMAVLFSLKRRLKGNLLVLFAFLRWDYREYRGELIGSHTRRSDRHQLLQGKFWLDKRKTFFTVHQGTQRACGITILQSIQCLTVYDPKTPSLSS